LIDIKGNPFLDDDEMLISADSDQSDDQVDKKKAVVSKNRQDQGKQSQKLNMQEKMKNFGTMNADISDSTDEDGDDDDDDEDDDDDDDDEEEENEDDDDMVTGQGGTGKPRQGDQGRKKINKDDSDSDNF